MRTYRLLILLLVIIFIPVIHAEASDPYLSASTMMYLSSETPPQPGPISGPNRPCPGTQQTYSIAPVPLAKDYIWYPPGGMTILSDDNTSIEVNIGSNCQGSLSVKAVGNDNTLSPARSLYIYKPTINADIQADSYIEGSTIEIEGEIHYEIANDQNPLEIKVDVTTNINGSHWKIIPDVSWLTEPPTTYYGNETGIPVDYTKNLSGSQRTGKLEFGCVTSYPMDAVYIVQKAVYVDFESVTGMISGAGTSSDPYILSAEGGTLEIDVASNSAWTITNTPAWLTLTSAGSGGSGSSVTTLTFDQSINDIPHLSGYIEYTAEGETFRIYVEQNSIYFLPKPVAGTYLDYFEHPTYGWVYEVTSGSGNFVLNLDSCTTNGMVTYSDTWLSGVSYYSGYYTSLTFDFGSNPKGNEVRIETVSLHNNGLTESFTIMQREAHPLLYLGEPDNYIGENTLVSVNETQYVFSSDGGQFILPFDCNTDWDIESYPDWLFTQSNTSGEYDASVNFTYGPYANPSKMRQGEVVFTAEYQQRILYVAQDFSELTVDPDPDSYLSTNTIDIGYEASAQQYILSERGGDFTLDVAGDAAISWDLDVEEGDDWLIPAGSSSGSGTQSKTFNYPVNNGTSRTGIINLMFQDDIVETVYVKQKTINRYNSSSPYNWVQTTAYAEEGRILDQSIAYYDKLGRSTQTISRNVTHGKIIATETVYDEYGREWITTLPAPVAQTNLNYIDDFLDLNTLLDDNEITSASKCGWYYSDENTEELYVPQSDMAFTRIDYSNTQPGVVRMTFMPGETHCDAHPAQSYVVHASPDELLNHSLHQSAGVNLFALKTTSEVPDDHDQYNGMTKSVSIDPEGKESITYYDAEGKVISNCISADEAINIPVTVAVKNGYVDIHLSARTTNYTLTKTGLWYHEVVDLKNDNLVHSGSASSITLPPGVYRIVSPASETGTTVYFQYNMGYSYYSFNAYDEAGRLVRTLSPKDAEEIAADNGTNTSAMLSVRCSENVYDANGLLIKSYAPDEGETRYLYSKDDKIRFSQNTRQSGDNKFSYTNYDRNGNIVTYGEYLESGGVQFYRPDGTPLSAAYAEYYVDERYEEDEYFINKSSPESIGYFDDLGYSYYGKKYNDEIIATGLTQEFVRGRVTKTRSENTITWYNYTYDGLVDWVVQRNEGFDQDGDGTDDFFVIEYSYDFLTNLETAEHYITDEVGDKRCGFTHRYEYDFDSRLSAVYTTPQGEEETLQARYEYYQHGPLKRVELADGLQGTDYVYTLHGWLKSINHPSLNSNDPGKDGVAGSAHEAFQADVFAMALDYYEDDYERTGTNISSKPAYNRYDGSIAMQRWQNSYWSTGNTHNAYRYDYNDRNFLCKAVFGGFNSSTKVFTPDTYDGYLVEGLGTDGIQYDANGNITGLARMNSGYTYKDQLSYHYINGTNQLNWVDNAISQNASIADQSQGNYTYNAIGQMTGNAGDGHYFKYDVYGKVTAIYNSANFIYDNLIAQYTYDDRGFRLSKFDKAHNETTWYLRDLSGNILATYLEDTGNPELDEIPIYGTNRIGMARYAGGSFEKCIYELGDHLGNVRAVIAWDETTPGEMDILAATDYYPFGMTMRWNITENYRFGYQGQFAEEDDETGYNQFEARLYDSRTGRWMVPDPAGQYWSPYLGMGNDWINGVDPDGRDWKSWRAARRSAKENNGSFGKYNGQWVSWYNDDTRSFTEKNGITYDGLAVDYHGKVGWFRNDRVAVMSFTADAAIPRVFMIGNHNIYDAGAAIEVNIAFNLHDLDIMLTEKQLDDYDRARLPSSGLSVEVGVARSRYDLQPDDLLGYSYSRTRGLAIAGVTKSIPLDPNGKKSRDIYIYNGFNVGSGIDVSENYWNTYTIKLCE